jgi:hypothetical protein
LNGSWGVPAWYTIIAETVVIRNSGKMWRIDMIEQALFFLYSMLPIAGILALLSGIIGYIHVESWGDILLFPESLKWGTFGFIACFVLWSVPIILWWWPY